MRIAFVIHRYGPEIVGGPEHHCRLVAEHLAAQHTVDVLTTCARDSSTWKNEYAEGPDRVRGVLCYRIRAPAALRLIVERRLRELGSGLFDDGGDLQQELLPHGQ